MGNIKLMHMVQVPTTRIIAFCGPPCTGKSTLAIKVATHLKLSHLQMDQVRKQLIPASQHDKKDIDIAYRAMHFAAGLLLEHNVDVIVDSTYGRFQQRRDLEAIAQKAQALLFLIQCKISPQEAKVRFNQRRKEHAAIDLTEDRVSLLAESYPYCSSGLTIDTNKNIMNCLDSILEYLNVGKEIRLGEWSSSVLEGSKWPGPRD